MRAGSLSRGIWALGMLLVTSLALADEPKSAPAAPAGEKRTAAPASPAAAPANPAASEAKRSKPAADGGIPMLRIRKRTLETLNVEPNLGLEINAGVIPRAALQAELARGIGAFLRQVRTEPALVRGRFVGWRLLNMFPGRNDVNVLVLKLGDTVTRVNGRSVERPEEFKVIWDSLPQASELVLDIERNGRPSRLHYSIAD